MPAANRSTRTIWPITPACCFLMSDVRQIAVSGAIHLNNVGMMQRLAVEGLGIAMLARESAGQEVATGRLRHVLPTWQAKPIAVHAITETRLLPAKTQRFIEYLKECMGAPEHRRLPRALPVAGIRPSGEIAKTATTCEVIVVCPPGTIFMHGHRLRRMPGEGRGKEQIVQLVIGIVGAEKPVIAKFEFQLALDVGTGWRFRDGSRTVVSVSRKRDGACYNGSGKREAFIVVFLSSQALQRCVAGCGESSSERMERLRLRAATLTPYRFGPARQAMARMTPDTVAIMPAALTLSRPPNHMGP